MEGNRTVWASVAEMEEHGNSRFHFSEDAMGHDVPWSGRFGFLNRSAWSKLLGITLAAQQLSTASAESICRAFNSIGPKFDLIGLISAFGTAASTKSLSYSALNDSCVYLTGHIGPGSLNVASALFVATGFKLARILAFGGAGEDTTNFVNLDILRGLHYIGLKSNTECPVGNTVGASIVREHRSLWKVRNGNIDAKEEGKPLLGRRVGRDAKRRLKVIVLTVEGEDPENPVGHVSLKSSKGSAFLFGWLPLLLTIAVIVSSCFCMQWVVAGLILFGTLAMMIAVLGLRVCGFKYSDPKVAKDSPEGDILVVDDTDPEVLHLVQGKEEIIQKLFQRQTVFEASRGGNYVLFLAASMLYTYVLASVLYMSNVAISGQIHFAIANLIGLGADMVKASQNGKLGLAKKAREKFKIVEKDEVVFMNRTAAVAFVAKHSRDRGMLKSKKLLPCDGSVWQRWWDILADSAPKSEDVSSDAAAESAQKEQDLLLTTLLSDMNDGLAA